MIEKASTRQLVKRLSLVTLGMFFFGFALVPIYDLICDVTGLNGKTNSEAYVPVTNLIDTSREVTVQFVATNNDGMPWEFRPSAFEMKVNPGQQIQTTFYAKNPLGDMMIAQAIPSIAPSRAAAYFHKTECFCFNQQTLAGGEAIDMPLSFIVDRDIPGSVKTITLSYTLFDVTSDKKAESTTLAVR